MKVVENTNDILKLVFVYEVTIQVTFIICVYFGHFVITLTLDDLEPIDITGNLCRAGLDC